MNKSNDSEYFKSTQKDYSHAFKLSIVVEVGRGELGIKATARKYGNFDWLNKSTLRRPKTEIKSSI